MLLPIAFAHALGHAGGVISVGAGAVSFAQTVKAAEPAFTCVLSSDDGPGVEQRFVQKLCQGSLGS